MYISKLIRGKIIYKELFLLGLCTLAFLGCLLVAHLRGVEDRWKEERKFGKRIEERKIEEKKRISFMEFVYISISRMFAGCEFKRRRR
jgi:hypothetical protein